MPVPENFDWVTARKGCTRQGAFADLKKLVQRDVEIAQHATARLLKFDDKPDDEDPGFRVRLLSTSMKEPIALSAFTLNKGGEIELIIIKQTKTSWTFTPRLSDDGERVFGASNGGVYQLWQVSRIALEPLIFR